MTDLIFADSKGLLVRFGLGIGVLIGLISSLFAISWQLGDLLGDITSATDPNASAIAITALRLAPSDPKGYALRAEAESDPEKSIFYFEEAVRSAPYDYRWRIDLGRAYEQNDRPADAEDQFKRAVDLASSYGAPHWYLGNFYLRHENVDAALNELKMAADSNETYRDQVFSLAWDYFGKDVGRVERMAGEKPIAIARLAVFFAARGYAADSLRNWDRLSAEDKSQYLNEAKALATGLFEQRHFTEALAFTHDLGTGPEASAEAVTNPSFEKSLAENVRFDWQIDHTLPKFGITTDSKVKHEGNRSLKATFSGYSKASFANILQTIVVKPGARYRLTFWLRTENLRSAGPPVAEVINANSDSFIIRSEPFPANIDDWQKVELDFAVPENCDGITIRTGRAFCGDDCPLTGAFWYDDFTLTKL